jgi:hypothetical protein
MFGRSKTDAVLRSLSFIFKRGGDLHADGIVLWFSHLSAKSLFLRLLIGGGIVVTLQIQGIIRSSLPIAYHFDSFLWFVCICMLSVSCWRAGQLDRHSCNRKRTDPGFGYIAGRRAVRSQDIDWTVDHGYDSLFLRVYCLFLNNFGGRICCFLGKVRIGDVLKLVQGFLFGLHKIQGKLQWNLPYAHPKIIHPNGCFGIEAVGPIQDQHLFFYILELLIFLITFRLFHEFLANISDISDLHF